MIYDIVATIALGAALNIGPLDEEYTKYPVDQVAALGPTFDTGQIRYIPNVAYLPDGAVGAALEIKNRELTLKDAQLKGYTIANLGKQVRKISGTFVLHAGSSNLTGSASINVFNNLPNGINSPDSGFHSAITRTTWKVNAFINDVQPFPPPGTRTRDLEIAHGYFVPPLPADRPIYFSAAFDVAAGTFTMTINLDGPNGSSITSYDDSGNIMPLTIGLYSNVPDSPGIGNFPCWEAFQQTSTDDRVGFISIHAE
jgi:hypothetical protein